MTERIKSLLDRTFAKEQKKFRRDHDWNLLLDTSIVAKVGDSPRDVANLIALARPNLRAAIVGKALYDGRTTLKEMNDAAGCNT